MSPRRTDGAKKPGRLRGAENRSRALALRIAGASTPEIAAELGVSRQHAWRLLDTAARGLAAEIEDRAVEWRAIQSTRIEEDIARVRALARAGNLAAYNVLVRLYERQARLLGLDLRLPEASAEVNFNIITAPPWERPGGEVVDAPEVEEAQGLPEGSSERAG